MCLAGVAHFTSTKCLVLPLQTTFMSQLSMHAQGGSYLLPLSFSSTNPAIAGFELLIYARAAFSLAPTGVSANGPDTVNDHVSSWICYKNSAARSLHCVLCYQSASRLHS